MDDQCGIFADEAEIPLFCIKNAEQAAAMLLHCIGRRNVESIVCSDFGSVRVRFRRGSRQKLREGRCFCLLVASRGPDFESAVDKIR